MPDKMVPAYTRTTRDHEGHKISVTLYKASPKIENPQWHYAVAVLWTTSLDMREEVGFHHRHQARESYDSALGHECIGRIRGRDCRHRTEQEKQEAKTMLQQVVEDAKKRSHPNWRKH